MARRRRLTPAQPGHAAPTAAPEAKTALPVPAALTGAEPAPASSGPGAALAPRAAPVIPPIAQVSGQSAEAAALRDVTAGIEAARATGRMVIDVPLGDVSQGYLARDRIALDAGEIAALKSSIAAHGQRTPAEITPLHGAGRDERDGAPAQPWGLIAGWRRLRALSELYEETGDVRYSTLRALVRPPEEAAQSYVAMVEENEIRVGLSYYERARVVAEAAARGVFADQSAALRTLFATASRAKRSKIGSFIDIHEALGDLLHFPAEIPERLGLALVSRLRLEGRRRLRAALCDARPATAAAELALLEKLARPPRLTDAVSRAKQPAREVLRDGIEMRIKRAGGRISATLSGPGLDDETLEAVRQIISGRDR
ncbi:nuclease [Meridianimarinicoccus roseus]|uniref:Nuclease n=1 Tax=Meridianimarinicoccus roseus TaxID=2072018 RepID=A0A2V2LJC7_9RHOB|nr:ParB N-terminal domain-containing protein [Meridianimarinicoccus roseus]PWR01953.1 nuclease [Meridianimarinicoccus roseus]